MKRGWAIKFESVGLCTGTLIDDDGFLLEPMTHERKLFATKQRAASYAMLSFSTTESKYTLKLNPRCVYSLVPLGFKKKGIKNVT